MNTQIAATFNKTMKGFLRTKVVLFGTIAWPVILLAIISLSMLAGMAKDVLPAAVGYVTISMIVFALMLAGICNLAGNIARDRDNGLLAKLKSMPVSPLTDFSGRILGLLVYSLVTVLVLTSIGLAIGARFNVNLPGILESCGFMLLVICSAAGIGLIIGSLVKNVLGAIFLGIGFTVVTSYLSGIFVPYSSLSSAFQAFARIYPISSASASASYFLLGPEVTGYNPLMTAQIITTIVSAITLLAVGIFLYSKLSWRRE